jgi:hypothetical protein
LPHCHRTQALKHNDKSVQKEKNHCGLRARVQNGGGVARGQRAPLIYRRLFAPTNGYLSKLILFRESSHGGFGGWAAS